MSKKKITKKASDTKVSASNGVFRYPSRFLRPVGHFLTNQLSALERRRNTLMGDDPFSAGRADSLASPDAGAAEQFGHARIEALRHEMDRRIIQMRKALARVKLGTYGICEECGEMIDTDRLVIFPDATLCISCERKREKRK
ncbi:MAG: TraR/DksA family transcriptional regulator [bacterium]|nr:TraR/DksA family transcriptional regulator [bacterium]